EAVGIGVRKRSKQERARDAEERRVRADADREREERGRGESGTPRESAQGVAHVGGDGARHYGRDGSLAANWRVRSSTLVSQPSCIRSPAPNCSTNAGGSGDQSIASAPQSGRRPS